MLNFAKLDLETSDSFEGWNPIVQQPHVYIFFYSFSIALFHTYLLYFLF